MQDVNEASAKEGKKVVLVSARAADSNYAVTGTGSLNLIFRDCHVTYITAQYLDCGLTQCMLSVESGKKKKKIPVPGVEPGSSSTLGTNALTN